MQAASARLWASVSPDGRSVAYQSIRNLSQGNKVGKGEITNDQALQIATFIKEARDLKKNVWANCHAGICRSGAVVSLLVDLGWEYADSAESPGRIPNHLVYDKVRKHFPELKQSWDKPGLIVPETDIWVAAKGW